MSISFKRNRVQEDFESFIGVTSISDLSNHKTDFENHSLTTIEYNTIIPDLLEDSIDQYYNGLVSFSEGIDSVINQRFSWAVVKFYYSIYFLLRSSLSLHNYALIRNNGLYYLKCIAGEKPVKKNEKKYHSTHEGCINYYLLLLSNSDQLLSNTIESQNAYEWYKDFREIIQYRSISFEEPNFNPIWTTYQQSISSSSFGYEIDSIINDNYVLTFQKEYAPIAIPLKRLIQTHTELKNKKYFEKTENEGRKQHIEKILKIEKNNLENLRRYIF